MMWLMTPTIKMLKWFVCIVAASNNYSSQEEMEETKCLLTSRWPRWGGILHLWNRFDSQTNCLSFWRQGRDQRIY